MNPYDIIYNEKLGELLKDVVYPYFGFIEDFPKTVLNALRFHSEVTLGCSIEEYESVYKTFRYPTPTHIYSMQHVFVGLQASMNILPYQMFKDHEVSQYWQKKMELIVMHNRWNEIAAPYMEQARKFAEDKAKRDQRELQAKSKLVQLNGKSFAK